MLWHLFFCLYCITRRIISLVSRCNQCFPCPNTLIFSSITMKCSKMKLIYVFILVRLNFYVLSWSSWTFVSSIIVRFCIVSFLPVCNRGVCMSFAGNALYISVCPIVSDFNQFGPVVVTIESLENFPFFNVVFCCFCTQCDI